MPTQSRQRWPTCGLPYLINSLAPWNNDSDVNLNAPRLFSDAFYLAYLDGMAMIGMVTYTAASGSATRSDIRKFYNACLAESVKLHNTCLDLLLNKGLFPRPPFISTPDESKT